MNSNGVSRCRAKTFFDLLVWKKAHALVLKIYRMTDDFAKNETYGLVSQMRRAAISIPSNIAEGFKRRGKLDKMRFMNIAQGSLEEVRYQLILARDLGYGKTDLPGKEFDELGRLLASYVNGIQEYFK